ncbi:MAG: pseudaminic acid synthase [Opitutales bacterium]
MILPASPHIAGRPIDTAQPPLIVAELSANHNGSLEKAQALIAACAAAGADAIKVQTYTADSLTLPLKQPPFQITQGPWAGQTFHELYRKAALPLEWTQRLARCATDHGLIFFSTPFDEAGVDFLEATIDPPAYKIASYEIGHRPLLERVVATGKPTILSTGMATPNEIERAVQRFKQAGVPLFLLKCVSEYPAKAAGFNLRSMQTLREQFDVLVGLSDHTLTDAIALGATALGACIIEKHVCLSRGEGGVDSHFSIDPNELARLVRGVRDLHAGLGSPLLEEMGADAPERSHRRSIFVSQPIARGEEFTAGNLSVVRPGNGLDPWRWPEVLGTRAASNLAPGQPLSEDAIEGFNPASTRDARENAPGAPRRLPAQIQVARRTLQASPPATT